MKSSEPWFCPCCGQTLLTIENTNPFKNQNTMKASTDDFEQFWKAYPKKVAKGYCKDIWKRKGLTLDMVIPALNKAIASRDWQKDAGQFIPNPSTWLNQGRWEDEGIDYSALKVEKPTITSRLGVNEMEAFEWRCWVYPDSMLVHPTPDTFPFKAWPKSTQEEYLRSR